MSRFESRTPSRMTRDEKLHEFNNIAFTRAVVQYRSYQVRCAGFCRVSKWYPCEKPRVHVLSSLNPDSEIISRAIKLAIPFIDCIGCCPAPYRTESLFDPTPCTRIICVRIRVPSMMRSHWKTRSLIVTVNSSALLTLPIFISDSRLVVYSFTTVPVRIDSSQASIIFCAVIASSSELSGG